MAWLLSRQFILFVLLALTGCTTAVGPGPQVAAPAPAESAWRYALVVDASSSASTIFVYQWRPVSAARHRRLPRIESAPWPRDGSTAGWSLRVQPGLSAYAGEPARAAASLAPLLDFARERIPLEEQARTSLHLWGTAGLRLLAEEEREAILSEVDSLLAASGFTPTPARVISGAEEGVYGWLTVNYLLGNLEHGGAFPTVGALDLGGASAQITFLPLDHPESGGQVVRLGGNEYHLYSHSYLGLGQDEARAMVADPACFLADYPLPGGDTGSGDFTACRDAIRAVFARPCDRRPCSGFGVYQPPVYGDFLAFSVYAYTADFFDLAERLTPSELAEAGREFCAMSWPRAVADDPGLADDPFFANHCFTAAHVVELLTDGFGFTADTERIRAPLRVQGAQTGWTLGALLYTLAGESD